jgi:pantoate--beta-alanine ligase
LVALVPTMGALHAGHGDLLDAGRAAAEVVVASIFVNPLQFGAEEDFGRYPRDLDADLAVCSAHGVDVVFAPSVDDMYPAGAPLVTVDPGPLGDLLEGASRPGHFRGVLTVVAKLFHLATPDVAVFGEKDFQQLVLIRRLASDLSMKVDIVGVATRRDPDGLALSSRNRYLDPHQRRVATRISSALCDGAAAAPHGRGAVLKAARQRLDAEPELTLEYLALRTDDLASDADVGPARLLVAARVGTTRLIDNVRVHLP